MKLCYFDVAANPTRVTSYMAARERDRLAVTLPRVEARVGEGPFAMG
jgi:hypothetical protein